MKATNKAGSTAVLAVVAWGWSPTVHGLSCTEVVALVDAGVPANLVIETMQNAAPTPTVPDLKCIADTPSVPDDVRSAARRLGNLKEPEPPQQSAASSPVSLAVNGMDEAHTTAAFGATTTFTATVDRLRGEHCSSLESASYEIQLVYVSEAVGTLASIETSSLPSTPVRPHPTGGVLLLGCHSAVASAAMLTWNIDSLVLRHRQDQSVLLLGYVHFDQYRGSAPSSLSVETSAGRLDVPIYRPTASSVYLERARTLPDGSLNATAALIEILGQQDWE